MQRNTYIIYVEMIHPHTVFSEIYVELPQRRSVCDLLSSALNWCNTAIKILDLDFKNSQTDSMCLCGDQRQNHLDFTQPEVVSSSAIRPARSRTAGVACEIGHPSDLLVKPRRH